VIHLTRQLSAVYRNEVFVDSFSVGNVNVDALRAISYLTKGFNFHPKTLEDSMAICELESVLALNERDIKVVVRSRRSDLLGENLPAEYRFLLAKKIGRPEAVTKDRFPQRPENENINDSFMEIKAAIPGRILPATQRSNSNLRNTRLLFELRSIATSSHPYYDIFISERDMSFWKVVMQGPPDSIYADGNFMLYLHMEVTYPAFALKCRFITPIYHPNINRHGRICHSIFDRNWTSDTSNSTLLSTVYSLLFQPDYSDPVYVPIPQ
jgi:ubiquitin-protein ligase